MTISAVEVGRELHITVEGVGEPFIIRPLPAAPGRQITETYLRGSVSLASADEVEAALLIAVDGAVKTEHGWAPRPEDDRPVVARMEETLRTAESETVAMAAFFWQTVLGIDGVNTYLSGGGDIPAMGKALWALTVRLGISPQGTSPDLVLEKLMRTASTPSTSSPQGGGNPGKQPQDKRPGKRDAPKG